MGEIVRAHYDMLPPKAKVVFRKNFERLTLQMLGLIPRRILVYKIMSQADESYTLEQRAILIEAFRSVGKDSPFTKKSINSARKFIETPIPDCGAPNLGG